MHVVTLGRTRTFLVRVHRVVVVSTSQAANGETVTTIPRVSRSSIVIVVLSFAATGNGAGPGAFRSSSSNDSSSSTRWSP